MKFRQNSEKIESKNHNCRCNFSNTCKNLENQLKFTENMQKYANFECRSGAKVYESCRSRKMLKNAYLGAKIGFDAEEPNRTEYRIVFKKLQKSTNLLI